MSDNNGGGLGLGALAAVALLLVIIVGLAIGGGVDIGGARQDRQAQRIEARANLELARAEADAERAETRQAERDAAQGRALAWLPYLAIIGGGVLVLVLAMLIAWDLRSRRPASSPAEIPPALLAYLERRDRELWRAIAAEQRRRLPEVAGRGEVTIYNERGQ